MTPPMIFPLRLMMILEIHLDIQIIGFIKTIRMTKKSNINS